MNYRFGNYHLSYMLWLAAFLLAACAGGAQAPQQKAGEPVAPGAGVSMLPAGNAITESLARLAKQIPAGSLGLAIPAGAFDVDAARSMRRRLPALAFATMPIEGGNDPALVTISFTNGIMRGGRISESPGATAAFLADRLGWHLDGISPTGNGDGLQFYEARRHTGNRNSDPYAGPVLYLLVDNDHGLLLFTTDEIDWARIGGTLLDRNLVGIERGFDPVESEPYFDALLQQSTGEDEITFAGVMSELPVLVASENGDEDKLFTGTITTSDNATEMLFNAEIPEAWQDLHNLLGQSGPHTLLNEMPISQVIVSIRISSWSALVKVWLDSLAKSQFANNQKAFSKARKDFDQRAQISLDDLISKELEGQIVWSLGSTVQDSVLRIAVENPANFNKELITMFRNLGGNAELRDDMEMLYQQVYWSESQTPPLYWRIIGDSIAFALTPEALLDYADGNQTWDKRYPNPPSWYTVDGEPLLVFVNKEMMSKFYNIITDGNATLFPVYLSAENNGPEAVTIKMHASLDMSEVIRRLMYSRGGGRFRGGYLGTTDWNRD